MLSTNLTGTIDTGATLHVFSSSYWRHRSAARCYGLQIWQDGDLVRDFKPCIYEDKGMLYDTVTKCVYRPSPDIPLSQVGKVLLSGDERPIAYVEYVESDGKVFVDTGVIGKSGTAADMEVAVQDGNRDIGILDSRNGVTRCFVFHSNGTRVMAGYNSWYYVPRAGGALITDSSVAYSMTVGQRYHVESLLANGAQKVSIDGTLFADDSIKESINTGLPLYLFSCCYSADGVSIEPNWSGSSRIYWLKIYQGDEYGNNMQLVRDFKPVRLKKGPVVLWDFVENKAYPARSINAPYDYTVFKTVGPETGRINAGMLLSIR